MAIATTNAASAASDSAHSPISLDDAMGIDFDEPKATEEDEDRTQSETGDDEAGDTADEADEATDDDPESEPGEATEEEAEPANDDPDAELVTLTGGDQIPLGELKRGYLRERDYRHKTQDIANTRRSLQEMSARVEGAAEQVAKFLAEQLPTEPPRALAIQHPAEYTRQRAIYDDALAGISRVLSMANDPKAIGGEISKAATVETLEAENTKLLEAFPTLKKPEAREKFFADAFKAGKDLGFSDEEMRGFTDHRYFKVMHYALRGLEAERARKTALQKVANAPAVPPRGKPAGSATNTQARANKDAMKRLNRTGSIRDAMQIDF